MVMVVDHFVLLLLGQEVADDGGPGLVRVTIQNGFGNNLQYDTLLKL